MEPREYPAFPPPDPTAEYPVDDQPDATYPVESEPVRVTLGVAKGMNRSEDTAEYPRDEWNAMTPTERHRMVRGDLDLMLANEIDSWAIYENEDDDPEQAATDEAKRTPAADELPEYSIAAHDTRIYIKGSDPHFPWNSVGANSASSGRYSDNDIDYMLRAGTVKILRRGMEG